MSSQVRAINLGIAAAQKRFGRRASFDIEVDAPNLTLDQAHRPRLPSSPALIAESPMSEGAPALELRSLKKSFGRPAVDGLDLTVGAGEFYALLGPNGAGKTTTLRMVAGLASGPIPATSASSASTRGKSRSPPSAIVAWLPDEPMLYDKLDAARISRVRRRAVAVEAGAARRSGRAPARRWLDLWERRRGRCEGFSRGMQQKVALAGALIHDPRLLMLDEPLTGLDASAARVVKEPTRRAHDGRQRRLS